MFRFLELQPEAFGIDINDLSVKVVKLAKRRRGYKLISFGETELPPGVIKGGTIQDIPALAKAIKSTCAKVTGKKLGTKYAVVALPEEKSFSQVIQMPKMSAEDLRSAVPFEAENHIPLPIDKVYLDYQPISHEGPVTPEGKIDLLVNVMPSAVVDAYVEAVKKAGFIPYVMEVETQSVARALQKRGANAIPSILIDIGETKTGLVIFSGNSIRFTSSLSFSSGAMTRAIADGLGISEKKAEELKLRFGLLPPKSEKAYNITPFIQPLLSDLAEQIKKYLSFYHDHVAAEYLPADGKIEQVLLSGGGANLKKLPEFLSKKLKIPVELGSPLVNLLPQSKKGRVAMDFSQSLSFATAIGSALRGVETDNTTL